MNKHTPGPWKIINGFDKHGNGKYFPTVVMNDKESHGREGICINVSHDQEPDSIMANAYLIAAAPDMLEALKSIVSRANELDLLQQGGRFGEAMKAINKAEGLYIGY